MSRDANAERDERIALRLRIMELRAFLTRCTVDGEPAEPAEVARCQQELGTLTDRLSELTRASVSARRPPEHIA